MSLVTTIYLPRLHRQVSAAGKAERLPPGQYLPDDFPVLSAGPAPHLTLGRWTFTLECLVTKKVVWTWDEFLNLPAQHFVVDISCVTQWTKLAMEYFETDVNQALMLDANAVAGVLQEVFGVEMTAAPAECAHSGREAEMGILLAFALGPGMVLRCSGCKQVVMRIVQTTEAFCLDGRGAVYLRLSRPVGRPLHLSGER